MRREKSLERVGTSISWAADREFNDEFGTAWIIVLHADKAMVVRYDTVDDGKSESRSGLLGGKVRLEEMGFVFQGDAVAGIGDGKGGHL